MIISSTDEKQAYFSDYGQTSFLKLYFDNLRQGKKFGDSLKLVTDTIDTYIQPFNQQRPQLEGNTMMQNFCLNGCWGGLPGGDPTLISNRPLESCSNLNGCEGILPGKLILTPERLPNIINTGQLIDLAAQTITSHYIGVKKVWASVITPEIAHQRNEQGYSFQPAPVIRLFFQSSNTRKNEKKWQASFSQFTTPGDYVVTFKAKDHRGFITEAPPMILTVEGEGLSHARFDTTTNILHIPAITVGNEIYQADLRLRPFEPEIVLDVDMNSLKLVDDITSVGYSNFIPNTGEVYIPLLEVPNATGGIDIYNVQLEPQTSPLQFKVKSIK